MAIGEYDIVHVDGVDAVSLIEACRGEIAGRELLQLGKGSEGRDFCV
jgi:hypothetical protein